MGCCCSRPPSKYEDVHVIVHNYEVDNVDFQQRYRADNEHRGRKSWVEDVRKSLTNTDLPRERPRVPGGAQWTDPEFSVSVAIRDYKQIGIQWKRPHEIVKDPVLFSDGTSRFDIYQRYFGTCWFLAMMSNLADKPEICSKVINEDSYTPETDGVCHCRLWRCGDWVDVYMDDFLPVFINGGRYRFFGAMSGTDIREMWVPLLEKSLARLHGSYNAVSDEGGYPSDAYITLTGGVAEEVYFYRPYPQPRRLFHRIRNAVYSGALICCAVPSRNDGVLGLVGGHAYSLTGADEVKTRDGETIQLVRIRNPHGTNEWTGRWSDRSREWMDVVDGGHLLTNRNDGEFWMAFDDFLKYFVMATICSPTPDFDLDGRKDFLNYVIKIHGEWRGGTAAGQGSTLRARLRNPRFEITIPREAADDYENVPVVVQLVQKAQHLEYDGIRCDLFRVYSGGENARTMMLRHVQDLQRKEYYHRKLQCCFRFRLRPGRYIIVPSTDESGRTLEFLLRIFTPCPIQHLRMISGRVQLIPKEESDE